MDNVDEMLKRFEERNSGKEEQTIAEIEAEQDEKEATNNYLTYKDLPVALIKSEGVDYIACIISEEEVATPLMIGEIRTPGATEEHGDHLQIGMSKIYMSLDLMDEVYLTFSFCYILKSGKENDKKMYDLYVKVLENLRMAESGLVQPTSEDLISLNSGK